MNKKWFFAVLLGVVGSVCAAEEQVKINFQPQAVDYSPMCKYRSQDMLPAPEQVEQLGKTGGGLDLRSCNLSKMDLSAYPANLADYADFDSKTRWPGKSKMPKGFNPAKLLEEGRNPGLSVRSLHQSGIDGSGVSVAIIDQPLLPRHAEYAHRLKLYEQNSDDEQASMHGAAVASIAVGKTVGVAPKADLYYIAARWGERKRGAWDVRPEAEALHRLLEINNTLPAAKKIRVVSLSLGGLKTADKGAEEWTSGLEEAKRQGIAVFTTEDIFTLSRSCAACNADDNASYTRGAYWWKEENYPLYAEMEAVLFPTDYRVTAAPNGTADYVSYSNGGLSWGVPYAAGVYALAAQVYPALTEELFWKIAKETAASASVCAPSGQTYTAKYLIQPQALISRLRQLEASGQ